MTTYQFRLPVSIAVSVKTETEHTKLRLEATVTAHGADVLGEGKDWTEPGAIGLAILATRQAFEAYEGCGTPFFRAELERNSLGHGYCGDCAWAIVVPKRNKQLT
jgi:hypothetical protein